MTEAIIRKRRSGGRSGHAVRRGTSAIEQLPWTLPVNIDRPTEPLTEEGVARVHDAAMVILEEIGIEFLNPKAAHILSEAGCTVTGENVRMDRDFVMEHLAKAPKSFTITPRNPARQLTIGDGHLLFGNVSSPPNYWDMGLGRKIPGTREMCRNLLKLSQYFNCIHFIGGYPVEPVDIHASVRHLDVLYDKLTLTDKVAHAYSLGPERVEDVIEMARIASRTGDPWRVVRTLFSSTRQIWRDYHARPLFTQTPFYWRNGTRLPYMSYRDGARGLSVTLKNGADPKAIERLQVFAGDQPLSLSFDGAEAGSSLNLAFENGEPPEGPVWISADEALQTDVEKIDWLYETPGRDPRV